MQSKKVIFILFWMMIGLCLPAMACDLCAVYTATEAQGLTKSGFQIGISEQFTRFGSVKIEGSKVSNNVNQFENSSITQVLLGYNFSDQAGMQLNVPYIYRSFQRPRGLNTDQGSESGLGDISLLGHFIPYRIDNADFTLVWNALGGLKFPTGSTKRLKEELTESVADGAFPSGIHGHDLTLGTGSLDEIVGTTVHARWKKFFFSGNAQIAFRNPGAIGYLFANDFIWNAGVGKYLALEHEKTLALELNASGENKGVDRLGGVPQNDTGITSVFLGPKFLATWKGAFSTEVAVAFPVSIHNTGLQVVPDYRVRGSLNWRF